MPPRFEPGAAREGEKPGGAFAHGVAVATELRGLCQLVPTGGIPVAAARLFGAITISSLSFASADEPNTLGLGVLRLGEAVPEPDPDVD